MSDDPDEQRPAKDDEIEPTDNDVVERAALIRDIQAGIEQMTPEQLERLCSLMLMNIDGDNCGN